MEVRGKMRPEICFCGFTHLSWSDRNEIKRRGFSSAATEPQNRFWTDGLTPSSHPGVASWPAAAPYPAAGGSSSGTASAYPAAASVAEEECRHER